MLLKRKSRAEGQLLKYSFINNSILLTIETIQRNGFFEIWRQENSEHSIQILCFNPETGEFQAFDRYYWMDEPYYSDGTGCFSLPSGYYYKKDLWTPIKLHFTLEWLKRETKLCIRNF